MNIKKIAASFLATVMVTSSLAISGFADTVIDGVIIESGGVSDDPHYYPPSVQGKQLDPYTGLTFYPLKDETWKVLYLYEPPVEGDIVIPETFHDYPVTAMDPNFITEALNITTISIPKTVISIGGARSILVGKNTLKSITVAEDNPVFSSEDGVLFNKDKTELIKYPSGKTGTSYSIPDTVEIVKNNSFCDSEIKSITIPDSVKTLEYGAFDFCSGLTEINIPSSVEEIGSGFIGYSGVAKITVDSGNANYCAKDSVLFTADEKNLVAFPPASDIEEYTVPDGTEKILDSAFSGCQNIRNVIFPQSEISLGTGAFRGCKNLISAEIPSKVTELTSTFMNCGALETVSIPLSVTTIGSLTFYNCGALKTINYEGTQADWDKIEISSSGNDPLFNAVINFSDGTTGSASEPGTSDPTTSDPTTSDPTTSDPTTSDPTTSEPTTSEPTTSEPTTSEPTTSEPATSAPTPIGSATIGSSASEPITSTPASSEKELKPTLPDTSLDDETKRVLGGITVTDSNGAFEDDVKMNVKPTQTEGGFSFDITFTKDGKEVQPDGSVTVKIPVPEALKGKTIYVFHIENGKFVLVSSEVKDGFVIFSANHFSEYVISDKNLANPGSTESETSKPSTPESKPVSDEGNPSTGIALSVLPIVAAISAVVVIKKKK